MNKGKKPRITYHDFEMYLNSLGVPEEEKRENGGRCRSDKYGTWMRANDPIAFQIAHKEACRE